MVRKSYTKVKRNFDNSLPKNFSLIFIKNYPKIAANYHSRFPNPHQISHQSSNPRPPPHQSSPEMAALHSWGGKKASKPLNSHATRQSIHTRSGANHARERLHSKSPTQRHARSRNRSKRKVTAIEVWSLAGDSALLPCDLSTRSPQDSVQMVMWLKEGSHTPLFSVDYREQAGGRPQVWRDNSSSTACRAHLHLAGVNVGMEECTQPATGYAYPREFSFGTDFSDYPVLRAGYSEDHVVEEPSSESSGGLVLRDVELEDSAIYRCRVDFLLTPTRNARVNLTVVVPPSSVDVAWLLDKERKTDVSNEAGPFREGDSPTLVCYTRSAWPPPRVVWYEEDMMIDDSYTVDPKNEAVVNSITLKGLARSHHGRRYTCFAANSNLTSPISATVVITLALDVLGVRMDDIEVLSAGMRAEVKCTVWGSHPRTIITWTLGNTPLPEANNWVSEDGNRTVSMVSIIPESSDDGTSLRCAAHNPVLTAEPSSVHHLSSHYDMRLLNVNYPPKVNVTLGRSLDATNIKEGDDLYFECSAVAKPPPHKVTWSHNGEELKSKNGILVSKMTLVLQHVSRANAGTYTCLATNSEGTGSSNPLQLDVKYAPVCASSVASQHSVAKHENARISCNVLANPPVVEFSWAFNNTAEAVTVPHDRYVVHDTESVVNYTPVTELDYGTLLCWATNKIGQQDQPCVFQIIAAGKPDPPHNCRAFDVTISSLQVSCLPGDDGGLGQAFVLQVLEASGDFEPVVEVRRESPSFSVANLRPATAYRLLIKASNAKGESRPAELSAYTVALNHPQHETPAEPTRGRETGSEVAVGVLVGAILACLPVAILITVIGVRTCMRVRAARRRGSQSEDSEKDGHEIEGGVTGRPLINKQGRPGSVGGVSAETGSDITTITGGAGLSSTIAPTPSPPQSHHPSQVPSSETPGVLYQGGRIYSQDPSHELGVQVITGSSKLQQRAYVPLESKCQGENELLEITLPPPAAYDQGYQSAPPQMYQQVASCYTPAGQSSPRMVGTPGYQHVFQDYQAGIQGCHLPATASGYPNSTVKRSAGE
ncbi:contactin-4-like [Macrobrachium rosenbergii]|uniref:contactin-4-like n=1 Tax=Macrobrachium rosenbergii TaxID=79674 RepID=UPI0034D4E0A3